MLFSLPDQPCSEGKCNQLCNDTDYYGGVCSCKNGYQFEKGSDTQCEDINECLLPNDCHFNADCTNTNGSYICQCKPGTNGDGYTHCVSKYLLICLMLHFGMP